MAEIRKPVPGDVTTEPVATAEQSHVDGRVGPPTIAQDATAEGFVPKGVDQVQPGQVLPADFAWEGGGVELDVEDEPVVAPAPKAAPAPSAEPRPAAHAAPAPVAPTAS